MITALLAMYAIFVSYLLWDSRDSLTYWRGVAKERLAMLELYRSALDNAAPEHCTTCLCEHDLARMREKVLSYDFGDDCAAPEAGGKET